jgi:tripartite-type tricarboxylate transporter receptor subunit TctC
MIIARKEASPPMTPSRTLSRQQLALPRRGCCLVPLAAALSLPLLARPYGAAAQETWPTRPVRILVPFPAGSGTDTLARFYAERLARRLGQPVPVENMGGANGAIATRAAARAAPDGHTVFFGTVSTHAANPNLLREPGYDPVRDFAPVSLITINALALLVKADFPARDLQEFLAHARANPGRLNFGIGNAGGLAGTHLLTSTTGIQAERVTYRGTPGAITDLLGGRLQFMVVDLGPAVEHLRNGTLRALAVTPARRVDILPDVPTMQEAGIPGIDFASWNAVWVPARTPAPIVTRLNHEFVAIGESEEVKRFTATMGITSTTSTTEWLAEFNRRELAQWGRIVAEAGIPKE